MAELITATRLFPSRSADKGLTIPTRLEITGTLILRYGLVLTLLFFGAQKWTAAEAKGIQPLVAHSPFLVMDLPRHEHPDGFGINWHRGVGNRIIDRYPPLVAETVRCRQYRRHPHVSYDSKFSCDDAWLGHWHSGFHYEGCLLAWRCHLERR